MNTYYTLSYSLQVAPGGSFRSSVAGDSNSYCEGNSCALAPGLYVLYIQYFIYIYIHTHIYNIFYIYLYVYFVFYFLNYFFSYS